MRELILNRLERIKGDFLTFLSDIVSIPSYSGEEKEVVDRIKREMENAGFDEVFVDDFGNVIGRIGNGEKVIAIDGHIDVVGPGDLSLWEFDPFKPFLKDGKLFGRGSADQKGGFASALYGVIIAKELGLIGEDLSIYVVGSVMEEDCDGLCWKYILENDVIKPEMVFLTEPTSLRINRGQKGRMEIKVSVSGLSAHGSAPERGDNAIYKMASILLELRDLNDRLASDPFLGKGTLTVSQIFFESPSQCSVPDKCWITIDRRLTMGETKESALKEVASLPSCVKHSAIVELYRYEKPTYKGTVYPTDKYYPVWVVDEEDLPVKIAVRAYRCVFQEEPVIGKWTFSTNGVSICGEHGIPCVGFGPGNEEQAHAPNEYVPLDHLFKAVSFYACLPHFLSGGEEQ